MWPFRLQRHGGFRRDVKQEEEQTSLSAILPRPHNLISTKLENEVHLLSPYIFFYLSFCSIKRHYKCSLNIFDSFSLISQYMCLKFDMRGKWSHIFQSFSFECNLASSPHSFLTICQSLLFSAHRYTQAYNLTLTVQFMNLRLLYSAVVNWLAFPVLMKLTEWVAEVEAAQPQQKQQCERGGCSFCSQHRVRDGIGSTQLVSSGITELENKIKNSRY